MGSLVVCVPLCLPFFSFFDCGDNCCQFLDLPSVPLDVTHFIHSFKTQGRECPFTLKEKKVIELLFFFATTVGINRDRRMHNKQ